MTQASVRIQKIPRRSVPDVRLDGQLTEAYQGETVATVLLAAGHRSIFVSKPPYPPSRIYCNMGTCMQCLVTVNGVQNVRACQTPVGPGIEIETGA